MNNLKEQSLHAINLKQRNYKHSFQVYSTDYGNSVRSTPCKAQRNERVTPKKKETVLATQQRKLDTPSTRNTEGMKSSKLWREEKEGDGWMWEPVEVEDSRNKRKRMHGHGLRKDNIMGMKPKGNNSIFFFFRTEKWCVLMRTGSMKQNNRTMEEKKE